MLRTPCSSPSPPAESMDCNRRTGFYYDELLKNCINCTTVCGQHPKQCAPSCESKATREGRQSGDAGQGPPGPGWKGSQVTGLKLGKGQQPPPLFILGGCVCAAMSLGPGKRKPGHLSLSHFLHHTVRFPFCASVFRRPVLRLYQPGAGSAVAFPTLLSCLQPSGRGSRRGRVIFPEIYKSHIGVEM